MSDQIQRIRFEVLTDGSGAFTADSPEAFGRVLQVRYVPHGSVPLDTGADLDIVCKTSGVVVADQDNIGVAAFTKAYRQATHGIDGSASLYAATGEPVEDYVWAWGEPLTLTIANGGSAKRGTFFVYVG